MQLAATEAKLTSVQTEPVPAERTDSLVQVYWPVVVEGMYCFARWEEGLMKEAVYVPAPALAPSPELPLVLGL